MEDLWKIKEISGTGHFKTMFEIMIYFTDWLKITIIFLKFWTFTLREILKLFVFVDFSLLPPEAFCVSYPNYIDLPVFYYKNATQTPIISFSYIYIYIYIYICVCVCLYMHMCVWGGVKGQRKMCLIWRPNKNSNYRSIISISTNTCT
jgi:hypothetical protein